MLKRIMALILALGFAPTVFADEAHYYIGIDWGDFSYKVKDSSTIYDNANGPILRLGYDFNNFLAVEGHYSNPDDFTTSGSSKVSGNGLSAFARMNLRFKRATLYALVGGSRVNYSGSTDAGLAYGVGLDMYGGKDTALTLAYTTYFDGKVTGGTKIQVNAVTFGITHYFGNRPRLYKRY